VLRCTVENIGVRRRRQEEEEEEVENKIKEKQNIL
jgi:hypothetical protein